jgi:hypothetical protein
VEVGEVVVGASIQIKAVVEAKITGVTGTTVVVVVAVAVVVVAVVGTAVVGEGKGAPQSLNGSNRT